MVHYWPPQSHAMRTHELPPQTWPPPGAPHLSEQHHQPASHAWNTPENLHSLTPSSAWEQIYLQVQSSKPPKYFSRLSASPSLRSPVQSKPLLLHHQGEHPESPLCVPIIALGPCSDKVIERRPYLLIGREECHWEHLTSGWLSHPLCGILTCFRGHPHTSFASNQSTTYKFPSVRNMQESHRV